MKKKGQTQEELRIIALQLAVKDSDVEDMDTNDVILTANKYYEYIAYGILYQKQSNSQRQMTTLLMPKPRDW